MFMLSLALSCLAVQEPTQRTAPSIDLATLLVSQIERYKLPALGGAVVNLDGVVAAAAVGRRSIQVPAVALTDDRWHLGSCTKAMTATLAARLVERGVVSWDTTLGEVFGDVLPDLHPDWDQVTLELLLCHRAGVPEDLDADGLWARLVSSKAKPRAQRRMLTEAVLARPPASKPGTQMQYSNAGFAIAGAMLETLTDSTWELLMLEEVFAPLGMESAGFGAPGSAEKLDQPLGHHPPEKEGQMPRPQLPGPRADNPPAIGPAGTVHASLEDWGRFVRAHLQGAKGQGKYLKPSTWLRLHTPLPGQNYGFGWIFEERDWAGGMALTHSGSNTMWFCTAWLAPRRDFAVLVTTNMGGPQAAKACDATSAALIGAWRAKTGLETVR